MDNGQAPIMLIVLQTFYKLLLTLEGVDDKLFWNYVQNQIQA